MSYEEKHAKWQGQITYPLYALLVFLFVDMALKLSGPDPVISIPNWLSHLMLTVFFLAVSVHRFLEPLPPEGDVDRSKRKKKRNLHITLMVAGLLLGLFLLLVEVFQA